MPERGEVYQLTKAIESIFPVGSVINAITSLSSHNPLMIASGLFPSVVTKIDSKGKKSYLFFENGYGVLISYGMSGSITFERGEHSMVLFKGPTGECYWESVRLFKTSEFVYFLTKERVQAELDKLGYDILYDQPSREQILAKFPKRAQIGCVLSNSSCQSKFAGIGNYLRSMVLYRTKISPYRLTKEMSDDEKVAIFDTAKAIVKEVIEMGGHSIYSFKLPGQTLREYDTTPYKKKYQDGDCDYHGNLIVRVKMGSQNIFWCPAIQK